MDCCTQPYPWPSAAGCQDSITERGQKRLADRLQPAILWPSSASCQDSKTESTEEIDWWIAPSLILTLFRRLPRLQNRKRNKEVGWWIAPSLTLTFFRRLQWWQNRKQHKTRLQNRKRNKEVGWWSNQLYLDPLPQAAKMTKQKTKEVGWWIATSLTLTLFHRLPRWQNRKQKRLVDGLDPALPWPSSTDCLGWLKSSTPLTSSWLSWNELICYVAQMFVYF